jgi:hypothetical protein
MNRKGLMGLSRDFHNKISPRHTHLLIHNAETSIEDGTLQTRFETKRGNALIFHPPPPKGAPRVLFRT